MAAFPNAALPVLYRVVAVLGDDAWALEVARARCFPGLVGVGRVMSRPGGSGKYQTPHSMPDQAGEGKRWSLPHHLQLAGGGMGVGQDTPPRTFSAYCRNHAS